MKKTLLLMALGLMTGVSASAQAFVLTSHGNALTDGQRVDITSYWEDDADYFNPELLLTSTDGGSATATINFISSTTSPALVLDEEGFEYQYGIGNGKVQMCSFADCQLISEGKSLTQSGTLEAGKARNMLIELGYTVGYDDPGLDNKTVEAEFTLAISHGGESMTVTFYVSKTAAGISEIAADSNAPVQYYDLQGRPVANPTSGLYIKRQGSNVSKVVL